MAQVRERVHGDPVTSCPGGCLLQGGLLHLTQSRLSRRHPRLAALAGAQGGKSVALAAARQEGAHRCQGEAISLPPSAALVSPDALTFSILSTEGYGRKMPLPCPISVLLLGGLRQSESFRAASLVVQW